MAAVKVDELRYVQLGVRGENEVTDFAIDISAWLAQWPEGYYTIIAQRHDESVPYIAVTEQEGDNLIWKVSESDTSVMGTGYMEVRCVGADGIRKKTRVVPTVVDRSLDGITSDVPEPMADWVDKVLTAYVKMTELAEKRIADCEAALLRATTIFGESALSVTEDMDGYVWLKGGNTGDVLGDISYPVGSVYVTGADVNPGTLFGGKWEEVKGRVLLGESSGLAAGITGGSSSVVLSTDNLPAGVMLGTAESAKEGS